MAKISKQGNEWVHINDEGNAVSRSGSFQGLIAHSGDTHDMNSTNAVHHEVDYDESIINVGNEIFKRVGITPMKLKDEVEPVELDELALAYIKRNGMERMVELNMQRAPITSKEEAAEALFKAVGGDLEFTPSPRGATPDFGSEYSDYDESEWDEDEYGYDYDPEEEDLCEDCGRDEYDCECAEYEDEDNEDPFWEEEDEEYSESESDDEDSDDEVVLAHFVIDFPVAPHDEEN